MQQTSSFHAVSLCSKSPLPKWALGEPDWWVVLTFITVYVCGRHHFCMLNSRSCVLPYSSARTATARPYGKASSAASQRTFWLTRHLNAAKCNVRYSDDGPLAAIQPRPEQVPGPARQHAKSRIYKSTANAGAYLAWARLFRALRFSKLMARFSARVNCFCVLPLVAVRSSFPATGTAGLRLGGKAYRARFSGFLQRPALQLSALSR